MSRVQASDEIVLRPAGSRDLAEITSIYAESVVGGTATYELEPPDLAEMTERFTALTSRGYPYIVAEREDGKVLGYAYAGPFRARPAYRFIVEDSIYLTGEARGRGIGALLLDELISRTTALGFRQMIAVIGDARPDNPSVRLHAKLGFRPAGTLTGSGYKQGRWLDTAFMQLEMNGGNHAPPDPDSWPERRLRQV